MSEHYLEDFSVGQTFRSGRLLVEGQRIIAFAAEFDPQPFHLDAAAARRSFFGELTASGWYTAAVSMRLLMETGLKPAGGYIGAGADGFRWPRPVRPGDELRVECEVIEVRPSRSRLDRGLIKLRLTTLNQDDEAALTYVANMVVLRRAGQVTGETALSHGLGSVAGPGGTEVGDVTAGLDVVPDAAVVTGAVVEGDVTLRVATDLEAAASVSQLGFEGGGGQQ